MKGGGASPGLNDVPGFYGYELLLLCYKRQKMHIIDAGSDHEMLLLYRETKMYCASEKAKDSPTPNKPTGCDGQYFHV